MAATISWGGFRRSSFAAILALALLSLACNRNLRAPSTLHDAWAAPATVIGWVRGEARRPVPVDARGAALGLQMVEIGEVQAEPAVAEPGSCGEELQSLLPVPDQPGVVLLSNADGGLFRYADGALRPMTARTELPPIGDLVGFASRSSPLQLLVSNLERDQLWELEIGNVQVLTASLANEGLPFDDREAFLESYRVGRCSHGSNNCLMLVRDDEQLSLDRRAHPKAEPEILMPLGQTYVADVAYVDAEGFRIYLLTAQVCEDDAAGSAWRAGAIEIEAPT